MSKKQKKPSGNVPRQTNKMGLWIAVAVLVFGGIAVAFFNSTKKPGVTGGKPMAGSNVATQTGSLSISTNSTVTITAWLISITAPFVSDGLELAELVEINSRTVQKIEAGRLNILITTLWRLQAALGCSWEV